MMYTILTEQAQQRIAHVEKHLTYRNDIDELVRKVECGLGNPSACVGSLSSHAQASAIFAWFTHHDLISMRQWWYVAARLDQELYKRVTESSGPAGKMLLLLKPLLSNHEGLIKWFARYDAPFDSKRVENHKTMDFWAYQAILALRGEWKRLSERCEMVIKDPPKAAGEQKYLIDHQFFLALTRGDIKGMQDVLQALVTPKARRARSNFESGYTDELISTTAVIYAKIAWFHGHKVSVDTPYIPSEWLPMNPLQHYDKHYSFLE